ncbi:MAG: helix-turn-helix transcriptional regulator [Pseudomonadota bacterium]
MQETIAAPELSMDALVGSAYGAVMAPTGFQDFIVAMCRPFQLKGVLMNIRHADTRELKGLWVHGVGKQWMESYVLEYAAEDILADHILHSPIASFYASNLDIPNPELFPENRFYREWVEPQGMAYAAGAIVLREGPWLTELYLQRSPAQPPFARTEIDQLNRLLPHLQRALQMRQRFAELQLGQDFLASSLDVLAMPTFLFGEDLRVAHANRSAVEFLAGRDSLWLDDGHLQTSHAPTSRSLGLELSNAVRASRGDGSELAGVVLLPRVGQMPLMLMAAPMHLSGPSKQQGAALLFVFDSGRAPVIASDLIQLLFGLSEAEAELATALCGGKTLDDAAKARGTTINTVRSQLKSIFGKTGVKRQADLMSLLLASPAYFLARNKHQ